MHDEVRATGQVLVEFLNEAGEVLEHQELTNKVVLTGRTFIAQLLNSFDTAAVRPPDMAYMAIGTGTAATDDSFGTLQAETFRVQLEGRDQVGAQVTFTAVFPAGAGTGEVGEIGIFNMAARNSGTMLARVAANPTQTKRANTVVRVTWVITLI